MINLTEDIIRSIMKVMNSRTSLITHTEGLRRDTEGDVVEGVELRIDGPRFTKQNGEWYIWVAVNFLVTTPIQDDFLEKHRICGELVDILDDSIIVTGSSDNQIGCLQVIHDKRNR